MSEKIKAKRFCGTCLAPSRSLAAQVALTPSRLVTSPSQALNSPALWKACGFYGSCFGSLACDLSLVWDLGQYFKISLSELPKMLPSMSHTERGRLSLQLHHCQCGLGILCGCCAVCWPCLAVHVFLSHGQMGS